MGEARRKNIFEVSRILLLALLGAILALSFFSAVRFSFNAFTFVVQLLPFQSGETVFFFPPVGQVMATTHHWLFQIRITLVNIDPGQMKEILAELAVQPGAESARTFQAGLSRLASRFALRCGAVAFAGGAGAVFLLVRRLDRRVLFGGLAAALLFLSLFAVTVVGPYDLDAFDHPRFTGALEAAPWVVNLVTETIDSLQTLGERLELITANIFELFGQLEKVHPVAAPSEIRVLHVSDIHNNPAAFDFIDKIVRTFAIDLVIDTGDMTDYGTVLEAELLSRIPGLEVPYLFVPGNHDSPVVVEAMEEAGAVVLDRTVVQAAGLKVAGIADPSSRSAEMTIAPSEELEEMGMIFRDTLEAEGERPDLVAVHNPAMGVPFIRSVPLILSGHSHRPEVNFTPETVLINAGTTGASGLRGLQSPGSHPFSVLILYFNRDGEAKPHLTMADLIWIHQFQKDFVLQRYYRPEEPVELEKPEEPADVFDQMEEEIENTG